MIIGIGLDLVETNRIKALIEKTDKFPKRVLTKEEYDQYINLSKHRQIEYIAGRFCAKEAAAKALGTGIGKELSFQDITIMNDEKGRPMMHIEKLKDKTIHLSITHTKEYAAAQVIIEENEIF